MDGCALGTCRVVTTHPPFVGILNPRARAAQRSQSTVEPSRRLRVGSERRFRATKRFPFGTKVMRLRRATPNQLGIQHRNQAPSPAHAVLLGLPPTEDDCGRQFVARARSLPTQSMDEPLKNAPPEKLAQQRLSNYTLARVLARGKLKGSMGLPSE